MQVPVTPQEVSSKTHLYEVSDLVEHRMPVDETHPLTAIGGVLPVITYTEQIEVSNCWNSCHTKLHL